MDVALGSVGSGFAGKALWLLAAAFAIGIIASRLGKPLTSSTTRGARTALAFCLAAFGALALGWGALGVLLLTTCTPGDCVSETGSWIGVGIVLGASMLTLAAAARLTQDRRSAARWLGVGAFGSALAVAGAVLAA